MLLKTEKIKKLLRFQEPNDVLFNVHDLTLGSRFQTCNTQNRPRIDSTQRDKIKLLFTVTIQNIDAAIPTITVVNH